METAKHYLWSCYFAMEIWKRTVTLLLPVYPRALWPVVQDKTMVYEQEDVADALGTRHGLM